MPDRSDISPLSITDGKISKGAKIDPTKLAPATSGQVLIAGTDGKFRPGNLVTTSSGDTVAQGPAGATGATGSQGATGTTGATGADGTDATVTATTVNAAGAIMHTDVPDSDTGFVKRTGAETYDVDTATYSTTGHTHDHDALTNFVAAEHVNWAAASAGTIHATNYPHTHDLSDVTDSGTSAALDVPATGNAASGEVVKGSDTRLTDTRTPSSTLAHKASHETGESDALSPSDIGAEAAFSKNTAFNKNFGTATSTVCQGDDSRLSDTRTPSSTLAHKSSHETGGSDALSPLDIGAESAFSKNTAFNKNFGIGSGDVCQGNDGRLSDTRTPSSTLTHKSSHATGGSDVLSPSDIGASASGHTHSYSSLTSIPTAFAPSAHNHSGSDITSGTIDTDRLDVGASSGKVAAGDHAHASYITGNQSITLSGDVSGSGTTSITCTVDDDSHNHAIGTITGVLNASAGVSSAGKLIKLDAAGHVDATMINDADITVGTNQVTGLGGAAEKDVGTGSGDVAQGNHTHSQYSTFDIDDSSALTTDVWSASKIISYLATFYATLSNGFSSHKHTATVTGDASGTTIFYVTHNLGTYHVVVSVRHPIVTGSSATTIDDMFDGDQYTMMDVGHNVAPGVEVATINSSGNVCNNCIAIRFPTAPANGDDYLVTIIG